METQASRAGQGGQYLGFSLAGEEYGVDILRVKEILEYETVTKVPTTPASIRGVINLRGSVVPVVDLAVRFGLPETVVTKRSCIVVIEVALDGERTVMGLLAESVSQVIDLPASEIEPPPPFGTRMRVDCLLGMGKTGKKFVLLLDVDKVLATDALLAAAALRDAERAVESRPAEEGATPPAGGPPA